MHLDTAAPLGLGIDPNDISHEYDRTGCADLSDTQLFERSARAVAQPKATVANSFTLHAPLELMARRLLLPLVAPHLHRAARERLLWVAATYERVDDVIPLPPPIAFDSPRPARDALLGALTAGDVDRADAIASSYLAHARPDDVMALAEPTLDLLAAAGHAPIGFFLASRLATTSRAALTLLRPTLRELARAPQLRIEWVREGPALRSDGARFAAALTATPQLGLPGSDFIFPLVHQVDANGLARDLVAPNLPADEPSATAVILRVATQSMLQDDPVHAPYGWTHCLTLPQAVLAVLPWLEDRARAIAIAATYVVAFRAGESAGPIALDHEPEPTTPIALLDAFDAPPATAASAWFHATDDERDAALPELAGRGACHPDAHVAKYTFACIAAAQSDPSKRALYLAAAASLIAWWNAQGENGFRADI
jgi:hypothetical protein